MAALAPRTFSDQLNRDYLVRPLEAGDAPAYASLLGQIAEETDFTLEVPGSTYSIERLTEILGEADPDPAWVFLGGFHAGRLVGFVNCRALVAGHPMLGYTASMVGAVLREHWNSGLGPCFIQSCLDHFTRIGARRIECLVRTDNHRALSCLIDKFGFEKEGLRRQAIFVGGRFVDEFSLAKLLSRA